MKDKKLHPILEILIVAAIILVLNIAINVIFSLIVKDMTYEDYSKIASISTFFTYLQFLLSPVIASVLCFKFISKQKIGIIKLLVITLIVSFIIRLFEIFPIAIVASYGDLAMAKYFNIAMYATPIIRGIFIALFVHIFSLPKVESDMYDKNMEIGLFAHVCLLLFTGGIWNLIWIYRTTKYLNCVEGEDLRNPATKLLLCMFIPFYQVYWVYKSAKRIDKLAKTAEITSDLAVICIILEIFVPIIPPILMQDKIIKIINTKEEEEL